MEFLIGISVIIPLLFINNRLIKLSKRILRHAVSLTMLMFAFNIIIVASWALGTLLTFGQSMPLIMGMCIAVVVNIVYKIVYVLSENVIEPNISV